MEQNFISKDKLTLDEQVFFKERSIKHLAPHVLMKGFNYLLPFVNTPFMDFMLSVPKEYRYKKYLYKKIMTTAFPEIFKLEAESNFGLPMNASKSKVLLRKSILKGKNKIRKTFPSIPLSPPPTVNYLDWNWAFRKKKDLIYLAEEQLKDLIQRNVVDWIDIADIWSTHKKGIQNHSDIIMILISLELYLKNGYEF